MQYLGPREAGISFSREHSHSHLSPTDKLVKIERWFYGAQVWLKFQAMLGYPPRERPPSQGDKGMLLRAYPSFFDRASGPEEIMCAAEWKGAEWNLAEWDIKAVVTYRQADYVTHTTEDVAKYMCLTFGDGEFFIPR